MKVVNYPDPVLRHRAEPLEEIDEEIGERIGDMLRLMVEHRGIGLAAPQVGWSVRVFVFNHTGEPEDFRVLINPEIIESNGEATAEEGCLSLPGINGKITRADTITVEAYDIDGNKFSIEADGLQARVIQHENDHLNGILIIDKMSPVERQRADKGLKALKDKYEKTHPEAAQS